MIAAEEEPFLGGRIWRTTQKPDLSLVVCYQRRSHSSLFIDTQPQQPPQHPTTLDKQPTIAPASYPLSFISLPIIASWDTLTLLEIPSSFPCHDRHDPDLRSLTSVSIPCKNGSACTVRSSYLSRHPGSDQKPS
ncbi:hypothetical protein TWF106_008216 [Orbilia oligospora]|uniref:Uncharacterized protein n=1 Tax=Orbilia oligospora TaxID=2813651 RepID=A0A7C8UJZ3_ORBOL|nr:hypothetical protein TWF679_006753 [Orbilia oligospora]KAF3216589.1 hypothetical protein TWF106_008216 [Orbilia oligospora]